MSSSPTHPTRSVQNVRSKRTTGKWRTLRVWISVSDSNSSSRVPKPPGKITNPSADFTNIVLLVRKLDVEADREPAALLGASVRRFHHPRPASRHDREPGRGKPPGHVASGLIPAMLLADARGAEDRHRRPVDPVDRLEAGAELGGDPLDVALEVLVLAPLVEDASVFQGLDAALDVRRAHRDPEGG